MLRSVIDRSSRYLLCLLVGLVCCWHNVSASNVVVYTNANIYTLDESNPTAEAIAFTNDGLILKVDSNESVVSEFGEGTDLNGAMILPGFQDAHIHAVEAGQFGAFCTLSQFGRERTWLRDLRQCAEDQDGWPWVLAAGVNISHLLKTVDQPVELADKAVPDRPLLVVDDLGHGAWGNSQAIKQSGLSQPDDNHPGSIVVRDSRGKLSGIVLESAAQQLIDAVRLPPGWRRDFGLDYALEEFRRHGITTVSDAGGFVPRGHPNLWYESLADGELTVRASNAFYLYPQLDPARQIAALVAQLDDSVDQQLRFNQVKIYVDGILSQTTGLVLKDYNKSLDLPLDGRRGFSYFDRDVLFRYARELSTAGFQLHFHATGDMGVRTALDALEQADPQSGPHRITHLYLVDPEDIPRFAELDVVADFQLTPSSTDRDYRVDIGQLIGDRNQRLMPLREIADTGALVVISSDWDADELSPLRKLQSALAWPSGPRSLHDALEMMTLNAAKLLKHDHLTGSLVTGKRADLVVLSENLFEVDVSQLSRVKVLMTYLDGEIVYQAASFEASDSQFNSR